MTCNAHRLASCTAVSCAQAASARCFCRVTGLVAAADCLVCVQATGRPLPNDARGVLGRCNCPSCTLDQPSQPSCSSKHQSPANIGKVAVADCFFGWDQALLTTLLQWQLAQVGPSSPQDGADALLVAQAVRCALRHSLLCLLPSPTCDSALTTTERAASKVQSTDRSEHPPIPGLVEARACFRSVPRQVKRQSMCSEPLQRARSTERGRYRMQLPLTTLLRPQCQLHWAWDCETRPCSDSWPGHSS